MSDFNDPPASSSVPPAPEGRPPLTVIPVPQQRVAPAGRSPWGMLFGLGLFVSLGVNFFLFILLIMASGGGSGGSTLRPRYYQGDRDADSKIAIVRLDGVIMDGMMGFVHKQIEAAVEDESVKAVVLRVNSPGGSITASDDLFQRLVRLRDGTTAGLKPGKDFKKPLVVSMGALAASGGYYVSMPAEYLYAERTTITGSIGVYAAFPNISKFAQDHGIGMNVIKKGEVKNSGSMFNEMNPEERQLWQDMVDHAYDQFLAVVTEGRPKLTRDKLRTPVIDEEKTVEGENGKKESFRYVRRLADGGIFTADQALKFGLIDQVGYLPEAVKEAAKRANLTSYRAIVYDQPPTLMDILVGEEKVRPPSLKILEPEALANAAAPRLWYLMPGSDLAGLLSGLSIGNR